MGEPEILLLDEPTASIDPLLEMEFIKNLRENLKGKTAILISHRIGFARIADRIVMMENGKITEQGTHDELLSNNGYYSKLFNEQKKLYVEE
jgi:ABC-type multidrug transport system fused ATPase/permease subunit